LTQDVCSVRRANGTAVIVLPEEVDITNADRVAAELASVLDAGTRMLVVDMTGTQYCDSAGLQALVRAQQRAAAAGTGLRLAASARAVLRVMQLTGADQVIDTYPDLDAATDGLAITGEPARRPGC
jgi:anti-sigma B factor antagonist